MTDSETKDIATRDEHGRFLKGQSGNPAGRPVGTKNQIVQLKQNLELAVRQNVDTQDIQDIVQAMVAEAKNGSVGAAKLILDKTISNAKDPEDPESGSGGVRIVIENFTMQASAESNQPAPIEGETVSN
jgi:hypothetical protein